jgi:hypothetical protein
LYGIDTLALDVMASGDVLDVFGRVLNLGCSLLPASRISAHLKRQSKLIMRWMLEELRERS